MQNHNLKIRPTTHYYTYLYIYVYYITMFFLKILKGRNSARYPGNTTFFLTNIRSYLHFYYFAIHAFYSNFLIAFLSFIFTSKTTVRAVESCSFFNNFSQRSFLNFNNVFLLNSVSYTGMFRRSTKSWSKHQLNSTYTVASLWFQYTSAVWSLQTWNLKNNSNIHW